jgi:Tol biopolymer transport system component
LESDGTLQIIMLDTSNGQKTPLPLGQAAFTQWLRDSSGFLAQDGQARIVVYRLNALQTPIVLTPDGQTDLYPTLSPDGKFVAVASIPARPAADQPPTNNVFLMNLDGANRRQITQFTDAQQSLTGLIWGSDGIYYSLFTGESLDTVFRMDLDGKNSAQVAQGALLGIAGIR